MNARFNVQHNHHVQACKVRARSALRMRVLPLCTVVLLLGFGLLVACTTPDTAQTTDGDGARTADSVRITDTGDPVTGLPNAPLTGDAQTQRARQLRRRVNFTRGALVESERGTYCLYENFVYFADRGTLAFVPLCGRPDCMHRDEHCHAYVEGSTIDWHDGFLYYWSIAEHTVDVGGQVDRILKQRLYRMREDGTEHEAVRDLVDMRDGGVRMVASFGERGVLVLDGSLYKGIEPTGFYYAPFDPQQPMTLLAETTELQHTLCFSEYDGLIHLTGYHPETEQPQLRLYDPSGQVPTRILDHWSWNGSLADGARLYYCRDQAFYEYDGETGTRERMAAMPEGSYFTYYGSDYIFLIEQVPTIPSGARPRIHIYDYSYRRLHSLDYPEPTIYRHALLFFGFDAHYLYLGGPGDVAAPAYYIDLAELAVGRAEIRPIPNVEVFHPVG